MIKENAEKILREISCGNDRGEKITLCAATKTVDAENINVAISAGITVVGENRAQEFRDKFHLLLPCERHFIGRIQSNKLKYIVGKADLIQSVDSVAIASEINALAEKNGVIQRILLEINAGEEDSKGGFPLAELSLALLATEKLKNLEVQGFMAMLPAWDDEEKLADLCEKMRAVFDKNRSYGNNFKYLSMGMSGDYKTAIQHGSNMIRVGSAIFGKRNYGVINGNV